MDPSLQKQLKELNRRKSKAQEKGDIVEEAKLCNACGELLSQYGFHEKAIKEHKQEVQLSEAVNDDIGSAIAHRKVGECLSALGKYKEALFHQNLHLQLAKTANNLVEQQRALATIGRTWFVHADSPVNDDQEVEESLVEAQKAFLLSLEICDALQEDGNIPDKELLEMRSRLYLNLGLVYESRNDIQNARKFIDKALAISRDQNLRETEFCCHYCIGGQLLKIGQDSEAVKSLEKAVQVAQTNGNKFDEADALVQLGQAHLKLGEFTLARRTLKKALRISKTRLSGETEGIKKSLAAAIRGLGLVQRLDKLPSLGGEEQIKVLDKLGDIYTTARAYSKALRCYMDELEVAKKLDLAPSILSPIYVSLAITYSDLQEPSKALECYHEELSSIQGNFKGMCDTWCNIAQVHEESKDCYEKVEQAYLNALESAKRAQRPHAQIGVLRCLLDTQEKYGKLLLCEKTRKEIEELESKYGIDGSSSEEEQDKLVTAEDEDQDEDLVNKEMALSDTDDDNDEDDSEQRATRRQQRTVRNKVKKQNEKGETPLHLAAIAGDAAAIKHLIEHGADINSRDYCGWQPIHEACNHGHVDAVRVLIESGASVNDPGGKFCNGITPLHDAAQNGHLKVVELLVRNGASTEIKNAQGQTPLDGVIKTRRLEDDDDAPDTNEARGRREVERFLRRIRVGRKPVASQASGMQDRLRRRDLPLDKSSDEEEGGSVISRFTDRLKQREASRSRRTLSSSSSSGESEASSPVPTPKGLFDLLHEEQSSAEAPSYQDATPDLSSNDDEISFVGTGNFQESNNNERTVNTGVSRKKRNLDQLVQEDSRNSEYGHAPDDTTQRGKHNLDQRQNTMADSGFLERSLVSGEKGGLDMGTSSGGTCYVNVFTGRCSDGDVTPALVSEHEADFQSHGTINQWLVDDLPQRPQKRRKTAKQTTLTSSVANRSLSGTHGTSSHSSSSFHGASSQPAGSLSVNARSSSSSHVTGPVSQSQASRRNRPLFSSGNPPRRNSLSRQTRLEVNRTPSPTFSEPHAGAAPPRSRPTDHAAPAPTVVEPTGPPPIRISVEVQGKTFLIPCPQQSGEEAKTIAWLAEQASLRYFSAHGLRPVISLQTREGASLSADDRITDVVSNNEKVVAQLDAWDLPPLEERYSTACLSTNTAVRPKISKLLQDPQQSVLDFTNMALRSRDMLPLGRTLQCHDRLVKLLLPGNRIGDNGLQHLSQALSTCPNLAVLSLRANGISQHGLGYLASVLTQPAADHLPNNLTLQKLEDLDLAFNHLSNHAFSSLVPVLGACSQLISLDLTSCSLTTPFSPSFAEALKASKLRTLSLAHNALGSGGIQDTIGTLPRHAHKLDLSCVMTADPDLSWNEGAVGNTELRELILHGNNLEMTAVNSLLSRKDVTQSLLKLDLSANDIGDDSALSLVTLIQESALLKILNLSGNPSLGNTTLHAILNTLMDTPLSQLGTLDLSSCGVRSPLPPELPTVLRDVRNAGCSLNLLDLSGNALLLDDRKAMTEAWELADSVSVLSGALCLLLVKDK